MVLGRAHQLTQRRPMDLACHHLEKHITRKDDKREQTSGGETAGTNTEKARPVVAFFMVAFIISFHGDHVGWQGDFNVAVFSLIE